MRNVIITLCAFILILSKIYAGEVNGFLFKYESEDFEIKSVILNPRTPKSLTLSPIECTRATYMGEKSGAQIMIREGFTPRMDPTRPDIELLSFRSWTNGDYKITSVISKDSDVLVIGIYLFRAEHADATIDTNAIYLSARAKDKRCVLMAIESLMGKANICLNNEGVFGPMKDAVNQAEMRALLGVIKKENYLEIFRNQQKPRA